MNEGLIASRYAKALLKFAEQNHQADVVYKETTQVARVLGEEKQLRKMLANPMFNKPQKQKIALVAASGEAKASTAFERFADLLIEREREKYLYPISLKYIDLYRERNNIHSARLTTAANIDAKTEKRIADLVQTTIGGKIELEINIDNNVLGGFVLDVDSNRWDASLAGQLRRIKKEFVEKK
jgi:F-type H+-transporting ATPase subunit delta